MPFLRQSLNNYAVGVNTSIINNDYPSSDYFWPYPSKFFKYKIRIMDLRDLIETLIIRFIYFDGKIKLS